MGASRREPGKLALISRDGGAPEQVIPDSEDSHRPDRPHLVAGWKRDHLRTGPASQTGVERMELLRVDLRTRKVTPVPGSEGLYSPRWSPDGRYLAAFPVDSAQYPAVRFPEARVDDLVHVRRGPRWMELVVAG